VARSSFAPDIPLHLARDRIVSRSTWPYITCVNAARTPHTHTPHTHALCSAAPPPVDGAAPVQVLKVARPPPLFTLPFCRLAFAASDSGSPGEAISRTAGPPHLSSLLLPARPVNSEHGSRNGLSRKYLAGQSPSRTLRRIFSNQSGRLPPLPPSPLANLLPSVRGPCGLDVLSWVWRPCLRAILAGMH
jgi:hypothetical protein